MNLNNYRCFLLDMDGTIFLGDQLIPGAGEFIATLESLGKEYFFVTNNSSRAPQDYWDKLSRLGLSVEENRIITSGTATVGYITSCHPGEKVYLLGTPQLAAQFSQGGIKLAEARDFPGLVVLGFDTTLTYQKLLEACELLSRGAVFIATHPDINCPLPEGRFMPDAGAMIALLTASTGREPIIIGKPHQGLVDYVADRVSCPHEEMLMVGDRLYTDIAMGQAGIGTALVLSGEARQEDIVASKYKPDFVFPSIRELAMELRKIC